MTKPNKQTNKLKEFFSKKSLVYLIIPLAFAISCKKYPGGVPGELVVENKFSTKAEIKTYINEKLDNYAKVIASLSKSSLVRQVVNEEVAKKFDGDFNVLIKDLYPAIINKLNKGNKIAKIGKAKTMVGGPTPEEIPIDTFDPPSSVDLGTLEQLLTEPIVVNADTLHPQIYIPFFDQTEDDYNPCLNDPYNSSGTYPYPVVVPYDGDETTGIDIFDGYSYDANGTMVLHSNISECFAKMHTVWAVTINENGQNGSNTPNTISGPPYTPNTPLQGADAYIPKLTIKSHKENWLKGGSEIYMAYAFSWVDKINPATGLRQITRFKQIMNGSPGTYSSYITNFGISHGSEIIEIRKFTRNEINKSKQISVDFTYAPLSRPIQHPYSTYYYPSYGDYIYLVIFEYDYEFEGNGLDSEYVDGVELDYVLSKNSPYLTEKIKIAPKNTPMYVIQNTFAANISNSEINFTSNHR